MVRNENGSAKVTRRGGKRLFCFGIGYSAEALSELLPVTDWHISGTVRTSDKANELAKKGINAVVWDGGPLSSEAEALLSQATHVLNSVPPNDAGDPAFNAAADIIRANDQIQWMGYLSTTGVYGNTDGQPVDEMSPLNPSSARSQRRVDAEADWMSLFNDSGVPTHVFRLAGIYGPGRSAFDTIRRGQAKRIYKPGHVFSRIHIDDIANILAASVERPNPGAAYNVCDDEPAPPAEVTEYACHLLGVEPPEVEGFETAKERMTPMGLSFWQDNRRVSNRRIREELGVQLSHPDYRSGLQAVLKDGG
jgi:nucleoside-diphosphate-sugar epimerase